MPGRGVWPTGARTDPCGQDAHRADVGQPALGSGRAPAARLACVDLHEMRTAGRSDEPRVLATPRARRRAELDEPSLAQDRLGRQIGAAAQFLRVEEAGAKGLELVAAGRRERFGGRDGTELSRVDIPDEPADRGEAPQVRVKEGQVADLPALELVAGQRDRNAGGP